MKKDSLRSVFALTIAALLLVPAVGSAAETVVRAGESVSISNDQLVEGDLYIAGGAIVMSGSVAGDMHAVGGTVTVNGEVAEDLTIIGGDAQVHAAVNDDVRVVGGNVIIAEPVGGDVFVIGGVLQVLSTGSVAGDVIFYGGEAEIQGPVGGAILGWAEALRVDAPVGTIDVTAARLTLGDRTTVSGDVRYTSAQELVRAQNAVVEGEIVQNTPAAPTGGEQTISDWLIPLMVSLFATLVVYLVARQRLERLAGHLLADSGKAGLAGLIGLFALPFISLLLIFTVLGMLLGLAALFATILFFIVAAILVPILAGAYLARAFTGSVSVSVWWIIIGTVLVHAVTLVPFIGPLAIFVLFTIALGLLLLGLYRAFRRPA